MRHVGDMDSELKRTIRENVEIDRIVKIASGDGVDRDGISFSKVIAAGEILLSQMIRKQCGFFFNFSWKCGRQSEFLDDDVRLDVRIVDEPDDRNDSPGRPAIGAQ